MVNGFEGAPSWRGSIFILSSGLGSTTGEPGWRHAFTPRRYEVSYTYIYLLRSAVKCGAARQSTAQEGQRLASTFLFELTPCCHNRTSTSSPPC